MKLLSWMHRKSQRDTTSSMKVSAAGSSCNVLFLKPSPIDQGDYVAPTNNKVKPKPEQQCHHLYTSNAGNYEESDGTNPSELFPGFLTIGTLSMERIEESVTPRFDLSKQEENEDGIAEIKYDLELINKALEKFLQAEGYLLGSSTEHQGNREAKKGKKSLHNLIQDCVTKNASFFVEDKESQKIAMKETRSSNHLTDMILQTPPTRPKSSYASPGSASEHLVTPSKPKKIKRLFQNKIHPEINRTAEETRNFGRYESKKPLKKSNFILSSQSERIGCWGSFMNRKKNSCKKLHEETMEEKNLNLPTKDKTVDTGREHWIKTDAEYFVLEL